MHKAAIAFLTESPAEHDKLMPSVSTFKKALQLTQSGRASSDSIIGGRKKLGRLQWCLAEAKVHALGLPSERCRVDLPELRQAEHPVRVAIPRI